MINNKGNIYSNLDNIHHHSSCDCCDFSFNKDEESKPPNQT